MLPQRPARVQARAQLGAPEAVRFGAQVGPEESPRHPRRLDADRLTIHACQGKGGQDRYVPLAQRLLQDWRAYWCIRPPQVWLFPNRQGTRPIDITVAQKLYTMAKLRAGIAKRGGSRSSDWRKEIHSATCRYNAGLWTLKRDCGRSRPMHSATRSRRLRLSFESVSPPSPST